MDWRALGSEDGALRVVWRGGRSDGAYGRGQRILGAIRGAAGARIRRGRDLPDGYARDEQLDSGKPLGIRSRNYTFLLAHRKRSRASSDRLDGGGCDVAGIVFYIWPGVVQLGGCFGLVFFRQSCPTTRA